MHKKLWIFLVLIPVLALLFSVSVPSSAVSQADAVLNHNMQVAIGLAKFCKLYALDHGGDSPADLSVFIQAEWEEDQWERFRYHDLKSHQKLDWLYFPVKDIANAKGDEVFFASPVADKKGRRIVVFADFSGKALPEKEFEALLRSQGK